MAGGSQIIINSDGVKVITPAEFEVKAGQHLFKGGALVDIPLPALPISPTDFSQKIEFNYGSDRSENLYREVSKLYVFEKETGISLHTQEFNNNEEEHKHESKRFYTTEEKDVVGLVIYKDFPLIEPIVNSCELNSDVYLGEDIEEGEND
jgi:hypothetical protein